MRSDEEPGKDYVGFVLRVGDQPLCWRVTPVHGRLADLLVVGDRCDLPGESLTAVIVTSRADVRRGEIEFSGAAGLPAKRTALPGGSPLVTSPIPHTAP